MLSVAPCWSVTVSLRMQRPCWRPLAVATCWFIPSSLEGALSSSGAEDSEREGWGVCHVIREASHDRTVESMCTWRHGEGCGQAGNVGIDTGGGGGGKVEGQRSAGDRRRCWRNQHNTSLLSICDVITLDVCVCGEYQSSCWWKRGRSQLSAPAVWKHHNKKMSLVRVMATHTHRFTHCYTHSSATNLSSY